MKINENINTCIICSNFHYELLNYDDDYYLNSMKSYKEVIDIINNYQKKIIIFDNLLTFFSLKEKREIFTLLKNKKIYFINITLNEEEFLFSNYIIAFYEGKIALEGKTKQVLNEEKILKRLGYSLPFIIDLSKQLKCYNLIDEAYYDKNKLIEALWN